MMFKQNIKPLFTAFLSASLVAVGLISGSGLVSGASSVPGAPEVWTPIPEAAGVMIPKDFIGMHHHKAYSIFQPSIDTVPFKAYRTHNYKEVDGRLGTSAFWSDMEPWPGAYVWTYSDRVINAHYGRGNTIMYNLYSPPKDAAAAPEGGLGNWQPSHIYNYVGTPTQLDYLYPNTGQTRSMYRCMQTGTSGRGEPSWFARDVTNAISAVWREDNGGEIYVTWPAHGQLMNDPINVYASNLGAVLGDKVITVLDADHFTFPHTSGDPGKISYLTMLLCIHDGTVIWREQAKPNDPNYHQGGNQPWNLRRAKAFITALLNRYNTGGIHKIKIIEVGNEPNFYKNNTMFFNGSAAQLVDMVWYAREAAKAVDPTVKVIPAGFTYANQDINGRGISATTDIFKEYMNATGPMSGKKGWETVVDGVSFHAYGWWWGAENTGVGNPTKPFGIKPMRDIMTALGATNVPMYLTEYGRYSGGAALTNYQNLTPADRKDTLLLQMLTFAALGIKQVYFYDYEGNHGKPFATDTTGVTAALTEFNNTYAGKTITSAASSNYKRIKLRIDGVDHIVSAPLSFPG